MRAFTLALLVVFAIAFAPHVVRADEPPAKPPATQDKKADEKKADEKKPDAKPEEAKHGDKGATGEATPVLPPPSKAYRDARTEANKLPYSKRRAYLKEAAELYLEAWKKEGETAAGDDHYYLGFLQQSAELWADAARSFRAACESKGITPNMALGAANAEARLYTNTKAREAIGAEATGKALTRLLEKASGITDENMQGLRGSIETTVASALEALDKKQEAHDLRIAVAQRDPMMAGRVYRPLVWGLLGKSHSLDGYDGVRKAAEPVMAMLKEQQAKAVELTQAKLDSAIETLRESNPDALDENGNLKNRDRRSHSPLERVVYNARRVAGSAKSLLKRLDGMDLPFGMLGKPVEAWTLEHAFGETKTLADLKGKVVVMDFWATWCPWCIKSFPAIRDLLEEYGEKGLVFVGVTASAGTVYSARYDLDDDLKDKAEPGVRARPAARLARGSQVPDGETIFGPEAFKAKEIEVITEFIKNHAMTWPVVMIDKTEPGPKYALTGWPHAVVVDRAGRVRYFKSGALLLDRKAAFEKFKQVLADLLSEKAP